MMRAHTIIANPVEEAHRPEPSRNSSAETMSSFLRPNRSDSAPIDSAPAHEPISTEEVMKPVWETLRPKSDSISGEAPEIMPVSKPNSMPPSAPKVKMNALLSGKRVEKPRDSAASRSSIAFAAAFVAASATPATPVSMVSIAVAAAPVAPVSCAADAVCFDTGDAVVVIALSFRR